MLRYFLALTSLFPIASLAQPSIVLSEESKVSLVTCGPGEALYEAFGHTAIRVYDPVSGFDVVYNYGTFDFNQPNFYLNFVKGRLLYMLAANRYFNFVRAYEYYNRTVREQELNLTLEQRQRLIDKLLWNSLKENRDYLYDYFFDNCSTRPRDVILEAINAEVQFDTSYLGDNRLSIRQLTDIYIAEQQPWGDLGIDLCLGSIIDAPATAMQYMYLPEELEKAFDNAFIVQEGTRVPLVKAKQVTFQAMEVANEELWFVPKTLFVALLLLSAVLLTIQRVRKKSARIFEGLLFMTTSFIGWNGLFLWFITDHYSADYNWNILWALPTNAIFGFYLLKKNRPNWTRYYALFLVFLNAGILIGWNYIPQLLHPSLKFIVLLHLFVAVGVFRIRPLPKPTT